MNYDTEKKIKYFKAKYLRQERRIRKRMKRLTKKILRGHCHREELLKKLAILSHRHHLYTTLNKYDSKPRLKPVPHCYRCRKKMEHDCYKYCDSCVKILGSLCKICFGENDEPFYFACLFCRSKYRDRKGYFDLSAPYNEGLRTVFVTELKRKDDEYAIHCEAKRKYGRK